MGKEVHSCVVCVCVYMCARVCERDFFADACERERLFLEGFFVFLCAGMRVCVLLRNEGLKS